MSSLPLSLKYKLSAEIHKDVYNDFRFFRYAGSQKKSLLSWISHRLVPRLTPAFQYLYEEFEELNSIYFIKTEGFCYVLPFHNNAVYKVVDKGSVIGFEDYPYIFTERGIKYEELESHTSQKLHRNFSVMSQKKALSLELPISNLFEMQREFPQVVERFYRT